MGIKRYKLKERYERLKEQLVPAANQDLSSIPVLFIPIRKLPKYRYIAFTDKDLDETLFDNIAQAMEDNDYSFFIKRDDQFIGFVSYWIDESKDSVDGIIFFNFDGEDNTNEMYKDTLALLLKLRIDYSEVNWEADKDNKRAVIVYKKYCERHGGSWVETEYGTIKFNVPGKAQEDFIHRIRETFIEEDLFEQMYKSFND